MSLVEALAHPGKPRDVDVTLSHVYTRFGPICCPNIIIISLFTHCNKNNGTIKKKQLILHFNSSRCHL